MVKPIAKILTFAVLLICLTCVLTFSLSNQAVWASASTPLLTLEDLPPGFTYYSSEEMQNGSSGAIANCETAEAQGYAFALQQDGEIIERVCVTSSPISNIFGDSESNSALGEAFLDAMLSNPDALSQLLGQEKPADLEFLELKGIGDSAVGFRGTVEAIGAADIGLFRRGAMLNTVFIIHPNHPTPLTSLQEIASKLDEQVKLSVGESPFTPATS
ncbi:hypothetical protein H6G00_23975 [Leptolyngbya sp. FACHB-541]|uniref:hypothetical protein n=1 Tax=Leptolyngbya sp. FACHB-541 TaxID=2692810 RepID=UPI001682DCC8|nr:hypothetical protein [Leptolyngbya sp. FACHB-541]MBD1999634.1 hypothetical protein [Leptolyngbya sp. FACHB-541]